MRKNADRFNGVTEEELYQRSLDDRIDFNLDIIFVNISPGLYSVYKGHHYSGPGNHFWRCLYDSGLTNRVLKSGEDFQVLDFKMGLVNMLQKPNIKSCQELNEQEIKEAQESLTKRVKFYKPKVIAFNGKSIYEIYTGCSVDKEFNFGKQPNKFANNTTDSYMFVLPSSSARCSQLPKVADKVPFYLALKKFRDHLTGHLPYLNDMDIMFPDFKVALEITKEEAQMVTAANHSYSNTSNTATPTTPNGQRKNHSEFYSDSEESSMFEDSLNISHNNNNHNHSEHHPTGTNSHKIKFVRLNNIPFSEIPADILENLKVQRQQRKNVTIITTAKDHFHSNVKRSNLFTSSVSLISSLSSSSSSSSATTTATSATTSDIDTASIGTTDSDYGTNSIGSVEQTNDMNTTTHSLKQKQQSNGHNSSKLSSLILSVCSSANSNGCINSSNTTSTPTSATNTNGGGGGGSANSSLLNKLKTDSSSTKSILINSLSPQVIISKIPNSVIQSLTTNQSPTKTNSSSPTTKTPNTTAPVATANEQQSISNKSINVTGNFKSNGNTTIKQILAAPTINSTQLNSTISNNYGNLSFKNPIVLLSTNLCQQIKPAVANETGKMTVGKLISQQSQSSIIVKTTLNKNVNGVKESPLAAVTAAATLSTTTGIPQQIIISKSNQSDLHDQHQHRHHHHHQQQNHENPIELDEANLISYELVQMDKSNNNNKYTEYYSFDTTNTNYPASFILSDEYNSLLRCDLDRVIKLHYDDDHHHHDDHRNGFNTKSSDEYISSSKRNFSSLNEANNFFLNSANHHAKRQCNVDFFKL